MANKFVRGGYGGVQEIGHMPDEEREEILAKIHGSKGVTVLEGGANEAYVPAMRPGILKLAPGLEEIIDRQYGTKTKVSLHQEADGGAIVVDIENLVVRGDYNAITKFKESLKEGGTLDLHPTISESIKALRLGPDWNPDFRIDPVTARQYRTRVFVGNSIPEPVAGGKPVHSIPLKIQIRSVDGREIEKLRREYENLRTVASPSKRVEVDVIGHHVSVVTTVKEHVESIITGKALPSRGAAGEPRRPAGKAKRVIVKPHNVV